MRTGASTAGMRTAHAHLHLPLRRNTEEVPLISFPLSPVVSPGAVDDAFLFSASGVANSFLSHPANLSSVHPLSPAPFAETELPIHAPVSLPNSLRNREMLLVFPSI